MTLAPPGIKWEHQPAAFLDGLVDRDIAYLDAELSIEALVQAGLHDEVTASFELDGRTVHWQQMEPIMPGLKRLDIFTVVEQTGLIHVIHMRFADGAS